MDGTDSLCLVLYGRKAESRDMLGGSEAKMLYDGATEIKRLRRELQATRNTLANEEKLNLELIDRCGKLAEEAIAAEESQ